MRTNLDVNERAVFLAMPPDSIFVRRRPRTRNALQKGWHILEGTDVLDGQGFEIVDPDRMRIAFKEEMIEFLRQAQSLFGLLELGNIARHCIDQSLLCERRCTPGEPFIGTIFAPVAVLEGNAVH